MRTIEFFDGNRNQVTSRRPFDEVPPANREVYLLDGVRLDDFQEGCQVVPIARVVKLAVDESGNAVPDEQACRVIIEEFAEDGQLLRISTLVRSTD